MRTRPRVPLGAFVVSGPPVPADQETEGPAMAAAATVTYSSPSPTADWREADRLFAEYARSRRSATRAAIIRQFEPLARSMARRYLRPGIALEDMFQVALVGLVKAVDRYDPASQARFVTFATPTILGELRHYLRDHSWGVHVPRAMQEFTAQVRRAEGELAERLRRKPSPREVAARLEVAEERVLEAQALLQNHRPVSLSAVKRNADEEEGTAIECRLGEDDAELQRAEDRVGLAQAMQQLRSPLRRILYLRYTEALSLRAVAKELGISPMQVCRLEHQALAQLRQQFGTA